MIEVVLAFLVSGWKENRCVPLPKMTAYELDRRLGNAVRPHPAPVNSRGWEVCR